MTAVNNLSFQGRLETPRTHPNTQDQKYLDLIQTITGDEFCEELDIEMLDQETISPAKGAQLLATAASKLSLIYRVSHAAVTANACHHVHDAWRKEADDLIRAGGQDISPVSKEELARAAAEMRADMYGENGNG